MLATMGKRALGAFGATVGVLVACGLLLGFVEGKARSFSIACSDGAGSSLPAWPGLQSMSWGTISCAGCLGSG